MDTNESTRLAERQIIATRVLDAPRDLVFKAWTDITHLEQWWGPSGFTTTTHEVDVRPGGLWRFIMHGPDGTDYPNLITFLTVEGPSRLVYEHRGDKETEPVNFKVEVTFAEEGTKTRLDMRMLFPSDAARDFVIEKYGALEGLKETMARLRDHLAMQDAFVITRAFDAPLALLWKVQTEVEHLKRWWGPKGFAMFAANLDLRPGGVFHYGLRTPNGQEMWGRFVYREVIPLKRLVYVVSFSDAQGGVTRHPGSADWPLEVLNAMTFTESAGTTLLTIRGAPINASETERRTFEAGHKSMQAGFKGTMDLLDEYLKTL